MFKPSTKIIFLTTSASILFYLLLASDLLPLFRGPQELHLSQQWPYYFVAYTFVKIWIFLPIFALFIWLLNYMYKSTKISIKKEWLILLLIVFLSFAFQIALVYFSRFGITVLFRRLVDPGINGYFSQAIRIDDVRSFLSNFPALVNTRVMTQHASGHTPGAVLLTKWFIDLISFIPTNYLLPLANIHVNSATNLWKGLTLSQKAAAITLPFVLHFITSLTIIPFYFVAREFLKNQKAAITSTLFYSVIPAFSFFALIFDPIYALFPLLCTLLIFMGVRKGKNIYFVLAGATCTIGLFFTAAILTYLAGLFVFTLISYRTVLVDSIIKFLSGLFFVLLVLYLFKIDLISSLIAVIHNQAQRSYLPYLFYNPFDFFQFLGIPISILFVFYSYSKIKNGFADNGLINKIFYTFWIVFLILILSGSSRGEVGRIWLPFMFIPIILTTNFITNYLKLSKNQILLILTLVIIQTILIEAYWVPIW